MNILILGDIVGKPGRKGARRIIEHTKELYNVDLIVANGENAAGGKGITMAVLDQLMDMGINVVTMGNHVWAKRDIHYIFNSPKEYKIIRPANYPEGGTPGRGHCIVKIGDVDVGVINISGRVFMECLDNPFSVVDREIDCIRDKCNIILVDFHAEATAEKIAMGWYLDGRVSMVYGTHTHVQTSDERILPGGTGYITDIGMVGPKDSVLGVKKDIIIEKFKTSLPAKFQLATGDIIANGILVEINENNSKTISIKRINNTFPNE